MNVLLVYPEIPETFWSFKHALKFLRKRTLSPPLGLLTVAAMLPADWSRRLVDLNATPHLAEKDLAWADLVFLSAMVVQRPSARAVIDRCRAAGVRVVAGGPLFTTEPDHWSDVDHLVLNEAEITLPLFLADLAAGQAKRLYRSDQFAPIERSPTPQWELLDLSHYASMSLQYSRGCPFDCDFCNVTSLLGHQPRVKSAAQVIAELDALWARGWHGSVFFVDDNFIGNKVRLKNELLPALIEWRRRRRRGITFNTEASINLADDPALMEMMAEAGFDTVFIGIETPNDDSLQECGKKQNRGRDLLGDIHKIHRAGLQVQGGFIVGFDSDTPAIFRRQIEFIQASGITTAMVGMLQAIPGTRYYERMKKDNRLIGASSGDNVDGTTNVLPRMPLGVLHAGYRQILHTLYEPGNYSRRLRTFLREYRTPKITASVTFERLRAFAYSMWCLGIVGKERFHYWAILLWTICHRPALLPQTVTLMICGYHFRRVVEQSVQTPTVSTRGVQPVYIHRASPQGSKRSGTRVGAR